MKKLAFIIAVCALIAVPVRADMILNGSFEEGDSIPAGSFLTLNPGSEAIDDWTVIGKGVKVIDYIGGYWQAADGVRSLDLNGNPGPGGVTQVISTNIDDTYLVTFSMAGNPDGGPVIKTMDVSAIGTTTQTATFTFNTTGKSKTNMGWTQYDWTFVADADLTTLQFMSTTGTAYGPALDMVSVVPIPAAVLIGMLGLGVAGLKLRKYV